MKMYLIRTIRKLEHSWVRTRQEGSLQVIQLCEPRLELKPLSKVMFSDVFPALYLPHDLTDTVS